MLTLYNKYSDEIKSSVLRRHPQGRLYLQDSKQARDFFLNMIQYDTLEITIV